MHIHIVLRDVGLFLLIATVANADRIKETTFRSTWPSDDRPINIVCAVVHRSFHDKILCHSEFTINVINAQYGYHRVTERSCSIQPDDCLVSVPLISPSYYAKIQRKCNGETQCRRGLTAEESKEETQCGPFTKNSNDYVLIMFYCLSSSANSTLITGSSEYTSGTPSAAPVTSVGLSSLSSWSTTDGATIASVTSVDNLGNVSTDVIDKPTKDNSSIIIFGSVVASVLLIGLIVLLVIIFVVRRKRNSEGTSTGRGNDSDHGVNGFFSGNGVTVVKCNTPQDVTHGGNKSHVAPTCISDSIGMPTHLPTNPTTTNTSDLAEHPHMYSLAQELSTAVSSLAARERGADLYSEEKDTGFRSLTQQPNTACYSLVQKSEEGFHRDIKQSNAVIYVNVTETSKAVYTTEQKANPRTFAKVCDPGCGAHLRVEKPKFDKIKFKVQKQDLPSQTRSQSGYRSDDLNLIDNSLYGVADTPSQNYADELTLTDNNFYECNATYT